MRSISLWKSFCAKAASLSSKRSEFESGDCLWLRFLRHSPFLLRRRFGFSSTSEPCRRMIKHLSSDLSSPPTKNDLHRLTASRVSEQLAWTPVLRP